MKYEPLEQFLKAQTRGEMPMTFAEIERIIGEKLPPSARKHRPWWSNNPANSVITHAWLNAGYKTARVDMAGEKLVFRRMDRAPAPRSPSRKGGFPLFGALAGLARMTPGADLTRSTGERWRAEGLEA